MTLYRVAFRTYDGTVWRLDTTDANKIGPWLAEMYGMFPYVASSPTNVEIQASQFRASR